MGRQNGVSGGGPEGNKVVQTPVRYGEPARGVNPGAVSYVGNHIGNHSTEGNGARQDGGATPWNTNPPHNAAQPLGNQVAGNVGRGGPGTGRVTYGCGTQGKH